MILDKLSENNEIKEKSTPSSRLYNGLQIAATILSVVFAITPVIAFLVSNSVGIIIFSALFYPFLLSVTLSMFCGLAQIVRQPIFLVKLCLAITIAAILICIAFMIYQGVIYGAVYIVPFAFPPQQF